MNDVIKRSIANGCMTVTLNRPEKLNACDTAMCEELVDVLDEADANDVVRAVVFTGEGRAFCAGGELPPAPTHEAVEPPSRAKALTVSPTQAVVEDKGGIVAIRMYNALKPLIAAVNGAAIGFGATMILPMDIRLASTRAKFSFPFTSFGGLPEAAASWFLPRAVGMATALEWCLTGEMVTADRALARGLIRSVHEPGELLDAAHALAGAIAMKSAPVSATVARHMLWRLSAAEHPRTAHLIESALAQQRLGSADMKEGGKFLSEAAR